MQIYSTDGIWFWNSGFSFKWFLLSSRQLSGWAEILILNKQDITFKMTEPLTVFSTRKTVYKKPRI
jgi:hypothetical protein